MKFAIVVSLAILVSTYVTGQDIITKQDGTEIRARVTEVGINEIKYKKFENLEGPVYIVKKSDVFMIKYENGDKEIIKAEDLAASSPSNTQLANKKTYTISPDIVRQTRTYGIVGFAISGPILGLAAGAAFSEDFVTGGIIGGVATLGLGITAPLIAGRARKTRDITHVEGLYPARLTAWILYGIAMADAVVALGLTAGEVDVPDATVIALGMLGAASSILFGLDAFKTAEQSEQFAAAARISPLLYFSRDNFGSQFTSVGIQLTF